MLRIASLALALLFPSTLCAHPFQWTITEEAEVQPTTGSARQQELGRAVALDGTTLAVGVPEHFYGDYVVIYELSGGTWVEQARLDSPFPFYPTFFTQSQFGIALALDGDTLAVGAPVVNRTLVYTRTGSTWTEQAQLSAVGAFSNDKFGSSLALQGDSLIVGAWNDSQGAKFGAGSVFVFERTGSVWSEMASLSGSGAELGGRFGTDIAFRSGTPSTILIGAPFEDVGAVVDAGRAYAFVGSGSTWTEQQTLESGTPAGGDELGTSVALGDELALAGAVGAGGASEGSIHAFERTGAVWAETNVLTASPAVAGAKLGQSIALSGTTLLAGADLEDNLGGLQSGAAYTFVRAGSVWTQEDLLLASNAADDDRFGSAVALDGDLGIISAPLADLGAAEDSGAVYAWLRTGASWSETQLLQSEDGAIRSRYGSALALSADTLLVGDYSESPSGASSVGGAYAMRRAADGTWAEEAWLQAPDGASFDLFGISVGLDGDRAVVGAYRADDSTATATGAVYVYDRAGTAWSFTQKLEASDGAQNDEFGYAVALEGDRLIAGARNATVGGNLLAGATYVFERSGGVWSETAKLVASNTSSNDKFGAAVALAGDTVLVGATGADGIASFTGAAYVFVGSGASWTEQAHLDDELSIFGRFGIAVDIDGDLALIGADRSTTLGNTRGAAYLYRRIGSSWGPPARLLDSTPFFEDEFGGSVAISGPIAVVGAAKKGINGNGAAIVYYRSADWVEVSSFQGSDTDSGDFFGTAVAVEGARIAVGAPELLWDVEEGNGSTAGPGEAYVFEFLAAAAPTAYCTSGTTTSGCLAAIAATGVPSASMSEGFLLSATGVEGAKDGLFFIGTSGQQAQPWGSGSSFQCVVPPVVRTGLLVATGTAGACDGVFARDLNSFWTAKPSQNPGLGAIVQAQLWFRDPQNTSNQTTSLSDAIEFTVSP